MNDKKINCPHCHTKIQTGVNFCPNCGKGLNIEPVKEENFKLLNIFCSVILSIIIGFAFTFLLAFIFPPAYTNPLIYICLFAYTIHPLCRHRFDFTRAYEKQNIFLRFLIGFVLFGLIFGLANLGNTLKQSSQNSQSITANTTQETVTPKGKSILNYYNTGSEYCSHFQFDGNSSYHYCVMEYIENNASSEINTQLKSIQHNCELSTTNNADYKNCIDRVIHEVSE